MPWLCEQTGSALTKRGLLITWPTPILPFALSLSKGERMCLAQIVCALPFVLSLPVLSMSKGRSINGRVRMYCGSFNATPRSLDKLRKYLGDHGANG